MVAAIEVAPGVKVLAKPGVYLLCFEPKFGHAKHYLGSTNNVVYRMQQHGQGYGARITAAAMQAGCKITLVRVWYGHGADEEYLLKVKYKASRKLCPCCSGEQALKRAANIKGKKLPQGARRNRGIGHEQAAK